MLERVVCHCGVVMVAGCEDCDRGRLAPVFCKGCGDRLLAFSCATCIARAKRRADAELARAEAELCASPLPVPLVAMAMAGALDDEGLDDGEGWRPGSGCHDGPTFIAEAASAVQSEQARDALFSLTGRGPHV